MVLSSGISNINNDFSGGGNGMTMVVKRKPQRHEEEPKAIDIPKSKIKFHKIKKHDKYKVTGIIPENYIAGKVPTLDDKTAEKLSTKYIFVSFKPRKEINEYFVNGCFMIDSIISPVRNNRAGTMAIKALVEKSISDKDTEGRILADVKIIDGETSAAGFFYKLGFKFLDRQKNEIMDDWIHNQYNKFPPKIVGLMYLPQEKIKKIIMSGMLL